MDKDGDKKGGDKKGGQSGAGLGGAAGVPDPASLLDAASLFAYWGRDPSAMAAAAASNPLFGSQFAMPGGLGGLMPNAAAAAAAASGGGTDRYQMSHSHPNTMAVAASQAASLAGLHSSWWSMAQLAAQDYFARLQASGMSQLQFPHGAAELAGAFPGGLGALGAMGAAGAAGAAAAGNSGPGGSNGKGSGGSKGKKRDRSSNSNSSNASSTGGGAGGMGGGGSGGYKNSSSPSVSQAAAAAAYKQSLYSQATLHKELMAITAAAAAAQSQQGAGSGGMGGGGAGGQSGSSKSKSSSSSHGSGGGSGGGGRGGGSGGNNLNANDVLSLTRGSSSSPSVNSSKSQQPSPSVTISASNLSNTSPGNHLQNLSRGGKDSGGKGSSAADLSLSASMNALNTLSQFGNLDLATQQNVTATMNALAASSAKAKDYMSSGILNDPSSLLGVRLPPDTEIIKYTSSIVGSKASGSSGRGNKRARMESNEYGQQGATSGGSMTTGGNGNNSNNSGGATNLSGLGSMGSGGNSGGGNNDRIEVIKLPPTITSNGVYNAGKGKDAMSDPISEWAGLNLSSKSSSSMASSLAAAAAAAVAAAVNEPQDDAPLNLSMKPSKSSDSRESPAPPSGSSTPSANSLQSLSTITAALGASGGSSDSTPRYPAVSAAGFVLGGSASSDGGLNNSLHSSTISSLLLAASGASGGTGTTTTTSSSSNNSGNGILQSSGGSVVATQLGLNSSLSELLKISNYEESDYAALSGSSQFKEGRPRNLGRGVSKPKKNTVASLLAQSRAVGSKPLTAQQLLTQEAEIEKLRQVMIEASQSMDSTSNTNTDTESVAESGMSESEGEEQINVKELRVPLEKGWRRETVIRGLTKNGQIKGDVFYYPPQSLNKMKGMNQVQLYLDQFKPKDLSRDNFSFSAKAIVGTFLQPAPPPYATDGEYIKMTDVEVARRLEELKMFTRHTALNVEQRIEIAKQQQALRDAKKMAKDEISKNKEKARQAKEAERNERLEQQRREREMKNQQALEERERRRQHMALIKQLELRRKFEEKEKKKHQVILDKLIQREKKLAMRKRDTSILQELRKPLEDSEIGEQTELFTIPRISGLKLTGQGFSDLLMVFEFLHNFGETLGFEMETLPTLQTLHAALTSDNAVEAEEELLSVMTHLLVCAIEDPGIPNPGRHTTLLGQTLRQADITHSNVSEILRIYLYAVAHGEVRQQSGINLERERERHHLPTEEDIKTASDKNRQFYELLSENTRYKLSELLKDKPFVSINPATKAQILAMLCNDLLLNKAVCKQIESSLETQAQLKKDRYVLDNKIRKYKMLVARKQRIEQYEKAQAAALEKSLSMKAAEEAKRAEEAAAAANAENISTNPTDPQGQPEQPQSGEEKTEGMTENAEETTTVPEMTQTTAPIPEPEQNHKDEAPLTSSQEPLNNGMSVTTDESPIKAPPTPMHDDSMMKSKDMSFNEMSDMSGLNVSQQPSAANDTDNPYSKSMIHDAPSERNDDDNSDLESEGTQLEEDEDAQLTAEEAQRKYERILETSFQNKQQLEHALNQLRVKCYGQDRYWRRYWNLSKCGGIYVEAMESAQQDMYKYENALEELHASQESASAEESAVPETAPAEEPMEVEIPPEDDIPRFIPTIADIVKRDRDKNKENKDSNDFPHHIGLEERKRKRSNRSRKKHEFFNQENANDSESQDVQEEDNSRTSFSNCEETRTDSQSEAEPQSQPMPMPVDDSHKMQPVMAMPQVQEPPVPAPIQLGAKKKRDEDHLMDIEDSIPTAILVQKGNNHDETKIVEVNNQIGGVNVNRQQDDGDVQLIQEETPTITIPDDDTQDGESHRHESDQMTTDNPSMMSSANGGNGSNCDIKPKLENGEIGGSGGEMGEIIGAGGQDVEMGEIKDQKLIKYEFKRDDDCLMERWFSIVDKDLPLSSTECPLPSLKGTTPAAMARQVYTNITCKEICQSQGNRWDIGNNIQFFSVPLEKGVEILFKNESFLSLSGLNEEEMNDVIAKRVKKDPEQLADLKPQLIPVTPKRESTDDSHSDIKSEMKQEGESEEFGSFSLPAYMTLTLSNLTAYVQCDQFQPLQMTPEEEKQMEEIKTRGFLKKPDVKPVPKDFRHGWWKINDIDELNELIKSLNPRGVRERNLRQNLLESLSEGVNLSTPYPISHLDEPTPQNSWAETEAWNSWRPAIARRVEVALLDQIEAMEDKVASASMQIKGWQMPSRDGDNESEVAEEVTIDLLRERIAGLEAAIERRYLKPPLGINTTEAQMAVIAQQEHHHSMANSSTCSNSSEDENIPKGLVSWRDAVERSVTTAQLSMALYVLESCVAWDKSIMKANCQFCQSGEQEDKLLLCDGCDRGYHTYCFKPRMDKIPDGDWYCFECKNKATGDRKCIVCGGLRPPPLGKMVYCELCPRAYHQDCYIPPLLKYPRGKWYCQNCISKAPPKKKPTRKPPKDKHNSSSSQLNQSSLSNQSANHSLNSSHEEIPPSTPTPGMPVTPLSNSGSNINSTPLSPAHSVASTTHEEPSSSSTVPASQPCSTSMPLQPDFSQHQQQQLQQMQHQQPQAIAYPQQPPQYANLEGTPVSGMLNSFQLPQPVANNYDPQQQYQQYYQSQQQHHQYYQQYNSFAQQQQPHQESHLFQPASSGGNVPNDHSSSMDNSLNISIGSNDGSQFDGHQTPHQQPCQDNSSIATSTPTSGSAGSAEYYSPSSANACASGSGYDSEKHIESCEEQMQPNALISGGGGSSSSSSSSHKSDKKDKKERDEAKEQAKKEKKATKKLMKELAPCKTVLEEMEVHEDSWPFLLPVNTKQFPTYRKVIKYPMDLSTIKKRLQDMVYKSRDDFITDVRQIFDNCEMFNEDDSPVGTAGHGMRKYFEQRWAELTEKHTS
ncbi:AAEL002037-PA [Aedes aegypti]|uniref:AAEL002037-PA n=1 Tax=Aedes aegypti TaxID=7159 RepID=Q17JN1_AEDAE|nr:AAEL002037-PA [Aedes aegypti]